MRLDPLSLINACIGSGCRLLYALTVGVVEELFLGSCLLERVMVLKG